MVLLFAWSANDRMHALRFWEKERTLNFDIATYYNYLPATVLHGDPFDMSHVPERTEADKDARKGFVRYGIMPLEHTRKDVLKMTCGVALFELPAFLFAHWWCKAHAGSWPADGYSAPYQMAVAVSAYVFVALGLLWLAVLMRRYTSDIASAFALIVIAFGSNLYFYATVDAGMSHGYLFFLFAGIVERTDAWHRSPSKGKAACLGLLCGLTTLIRPADLLITLVPLLWNGTAGMRQKWTMVRQHWPHTILAAGCAMLALLPQLIYWKVASGSFFYDTYHGEGFDWTEPHIIEGLFGFRKGWLVYSPLLVIGLGGLVLMLLRPAWRWYARPIIIFLVPFVYVVFCWKQWWYGGGFGARPLVETTALLALPTAMVFQWSSQRSVVLTGLLALLVLFGIHLNLFQHDQFVKGVLHWDSMTLERYLEIWGRSSSDGLKPFP